MSKYTRTTQKIFGNSNRANILYSSALSRWRYTNDGTNYFDIGSGGGGSHTVIVDSYNELPATAEIGTYGFVRDSLTGVYYVFTDQWVPVINSIIGHNKANLSIFTNELGTVDCNMVEGALKIKPLQTEALCGIYNNIDATSQYITTNVNICIPPIADGNSYEILGGIFIRNSTGKIYSLMTGFSSIYNYRIVKAQYWNSQSSLSSEVIIPYPCFGSDFNMLKLFVSNVEPAFKYFTSSIAGPIQDSNGYLAIDSEVDWATFFGTFPNQFGFCGYSTIENASIYFINNYAHDENLYNYRYTGFDYVEPPAFILYATFERTYNAGDSGQFWIAINSGASYYVDWGDGTIDYLIGDASTNTISHVYSLSGTYEFNLYVATKSDVLELDIDGSYFVGSFPDFSDSTNLTAIYSSDDEELSGDLNITNCTSLQYLYMQYSGFVGSPGGNFIIDNTPNLEQVYCQGNYFSGNLPDISTLTNLTDFEVIENSFSGTIPNISGCVSLSYIDVGSNSLTGSIPNFPNSIVQFWADDNQLSGVIPDLTSCTNLLQFHCDNNQITGYTPSTLSLTLRRFFAVNNLLSQAAVDQILADFATDILLRPAGVLSQIYLNGAGNAAPSAAGIISKNAILARGWVVVTN